MVAAGWAAAAPALCLLLLCAAAGSARCWDQAGEIPGAGYVSARPSAAPSASPVTGAGEPRSGTGEGACRGPRQEGLLVWAAVKSACAAAVIPPRGEGWLYALRGITRSPLRRKRGALLCSPLRVWSFPELRLLKKHAAASVGLSVFSQREALLARGNVSGQTLSFVLPVSGRVLLREVQALTLHRGQYTTSRRTAAVPQLQCTGGSAGCSRVPEVVQCYNKGWDGYDVQVTV